MKIARLLWQALTDTVRAYIWAIGIAVRTVAQTNRTLAFGLLATMTVWFCLLAYDTGSSTVLDQAIATGIVALYVGVILHMFVDRGLLVWSASAVGILLGAVGWVALFARFEFGWLFGSLTSGESQGWLDLVRASVLVGGPMLGYSLITYRLEKRRTGEPAVPGELLSPPTWPEVERRSGVDRRRNTAEIYGRTTEDTSQ